MRDNDDSRISHYDIGLLSNIQCAELSCVATKI